MKVIMLTSIAGVGFALSPGDTHECSVDEAKRLIDKGYATPEKPTRKKTVNEVRETR